VNNTVTILGTLQDGGYPQPGCELTCCSGIIKKERFVSCLSIIDSIKNKFWLIDITPDFRDQIQILNHKVNRIIPDGIFITHAHSGHYTGLLELGREVINTINLPVYVMPRMKSFLEINDPWKQSIEQGNIRLIEMDDRVEIPLNDKISVSPFLVPHRSEISETVGFKIKGKNSSIIYIPDIDSWDDWEIDISKLVEDNDILLIDGTFYHEEELKDRDINEIPHPRIKDSIGILEGLDSSNRSKVYFTHLNHTNNALRDHTYEYKNIIDNGFKIASEGLKVKV
jgi:pyrroloquinoline quinone biosynthesis protein B